MATKRRGQKPKKRNTTSKKFNRRTAKGGFFTSNRKKFITLFLDLINREHKIQCIQQKCNRSKSATCKKMNCLSNTSILSKEEQFEKVYEMYEKKKPKDDDYNKYLLILDCLVNSCMMRNCSKSDKISRKKNMNHILEAYFDFYPLEKKILEGKMHGTSLIDTILKEKLDIFNEFNFSEFETFYKEYPVIH